MRRAGHLLAVAATVLVASAHVGSPDVFFVGAAGPYRLSVFVRTPGVVPGLADISVRVLAGGRPTAITVLPVYWDPRTAAPPPADTARPVRGDSLVYHAQLWLMTGGSYAVRVTVSGDAGAGTVNVPIQAVATRRLGLNRGMAIGLGAFGGFLVIGLLTIIYAAAREGDLPPGDVPDARRGRRAWISTAIGAGCVGFAVCLGNGWWGSSDRAFVRQMYQPQQAQSSVGGDGRLLLRLLTPGVGLGQRRPLIPDHGHLMHLFLLRDDLAAFAHLHPVPEDSSSFGTSLPPLPGGRYFVYADLVRETGFAETATDTIQLAGGPGAAGDPDDAWWVERTAGRASPVSPATVVLDDGSLMTWERGPAPVVVGADAPLRFTVRGPGGRAAELRPYMGMIGHAIVVRSDGNVFVHLHPMGTISWVARQAFALRTAADTLPGSLARKLLNDGAMQDHIMTGDAVADLSFPYAFPSAGEYRVWVQVRRGARVLTGSFPVTVSPLRAR